MPLHKYKTKLSKILRDKKKNPYWLMKEVNRLRAEAGIEKKIQTRKIADYVRGYLPNLENALWIGHACSCNVEDIWTLEDVLKAGPKNR